MRGYQMSLKKDNMITITEQAVKKIKDIIAEENQPGLKLRVFVQGGGCSGMQYLSLIHI